MSNFQEFMRVADLTMKDKTSSKRMREILSILRKNGAMHGLTPEKAVKILEELGPTYVKVGQLASNRQDMLPKEYCDAFAQLRDHVTPMTYDTVIDCINQAYGHPYSEVFASIEREPLGAASIAQVHKATLLDGTVVAVKVRRPGIVEEMAEDIMLMKHLLALAEFATSKHEEMLLSLDGFVSELERTTNDEVDFTVELNNLVRFKREIADQKGVTSPTPYPQYSNDAVLVMEFVQGISMEDVAKLRSLGIDLDEIGNRLAQSYVEQVLDDGFFHADPHPGNIIVRNGDIVWIDLGMTGSLTASERQIVGRLFRAVASSSAYECKEAVLGLVTAHGEIDHGELLTQLDNILSTQGSSELGDINVGEVFQEVIEVLRSQNLIVKPSVTMLARGFMTIEGVLAAITPNTNILSIVSEHVIKQEFEPEHLAARAMDLMSSSVESAQALTKLPAQFSHFITMVSRGQLSLNGEAHVDADTLATLYAMASRLSLAIIAAGLFLGSSILCATNMEPRILEVPIIGFLGYLGAFVLSAYIVVRTLQDRGRIENAFKRR